MKKIMLVLLFGVLVSACSSMPVRVNTVMPNEVEGKDYEVLGEGEGSSVGIMLFHVIPINQNTRFQGAYDTAIQSKQGDRLLSPTIEERWFWAYLFNGYIFTVKGTVVKNISPQPDNAIKSE